MCALVGKKDDLTPFSIQDIDRHSLWVNIKLNDVWKKKWSPVLSKCMCGVKEFVKRDLNAKYVAKYSFPTEKYILKHIYVPLML